MSVVEQQVGGITIVGVVIRRWHLDAGIGQFVLTEEYIEVAVVVDISAGQRLSVFEVRIGRPDQPTGLVKSPRRRAFEQKQSLKLRAQEIRSAVAVEVGYHARENQGGGIATERFGL